MFEAILFHSILFLFWISELMLQTLRFAVLFLAICTGIEFLCIFLYAFYFPKLPVVKYFRAKAASEGSKTVTSDLAAAGIKQASCTNSLCSQFCVSVVYSRQFFMKLLLETLQDESGAKLERLTLKQLLRLNWDYFLGLYLIYVLTLSIFPGFLYENTGTHRLGSWYVSISSKVPHS